MSVGYPDWAGTRLLHGARQILTDTQLSIAPGASVTNTVEVTRPGYILELHAFNATDSVNQLPFSVVTQWLEPGTNNNLDAQTWYAFAGTQLGPHYIDGSGPTKGASLKITITNMAAATEHLGYFLVIDETSFAYQRHDWRSDDIFSFNPTGWAIAPSDVNSGILSVVTNTNVPANSFITYILPLYNGPIWCQAGNSGAAGSMELVVQTAATPGSLAGAPGFDVFNDAHGNIFGNGNMPRAECSLVIVNHTAAAFAAFANVMIGER